MRVLHLRLARTLFGGSPWQARGHFALYRLSKGYALFDDRTLRWRRISGGCGRILGPFLGPPWVLFDCGTQPQLYNLQTRRWRHLNCGDACVNTGVAAVQAIGSQWVEYNEDAGCDPKYFTCNGGYTFVKLPSGINRRVTPDSREVIDLNAPSLVRPLCAPLHATGPGAWTFFGQFGVAADSQGLYVQRCGSTRQTRLIAMMPGSPVTAPQGNQHAIFSCNATTWQYEGVFIPSLRRFAFSLPPRLNVGCDAQLGDREVYAASLRAAFPVR